MKSKNIPEHLKAGLNRYVKHRIETGSFLKCVLENDLFGALQKADKESLEALYSICSYIYNELPYQCWGSKGKVNNWLKKK